MITTLAAAVILVLGAAPAPSAAEQPFLAVEWSDQVSFTGTYASPSEAEAHALRIAACGFWRVDLTAPPPAPPSILVAAGALRQVRLLTADAPPPAGVSWADRLTPPLPPPPDVEAIIDCPAARRLPPR